MVLTDTHTHLYYEEDLSEQSNLMNRCLEQNISRLFLPNVDLQSLEKIQNLVTAYPNNCFPMIGLHPCEVKDDYLQVLQRLKEFNGHSKVFAIGEIGIDLYWDKTTLSNQQDAFKIQIDWAIDLDLPIVIHCRDAFDEVFEVLNEKKHPQLRGIFHCFTGSLQQANKVIELGFLLGIGGVVTYKNSGLDAVLKNIPIENIVLETDAPYLAPVPKRGKKNESSYLVYVADKVAEIYNISIEEVAQITTQNSKKVFNI